MEVIETLKSRANVTIRYSQSKDGDTKIPIPVQKPEGKVNEIINNIKMKDLDQAKQKIQRRKLLGRKQPTVEEHVSYQ